MHFLFLHEFLMSTQSSLFALSSFISSQPVRKFKNEKLWWIVGESKRREINFHKKKKFHFLLFSFLFCLLQGAFIFLLWSNFAFKLSLMNFIFWEGFSYPKRWRIYEVESNWIQNLFSIRGKRESWKESGVRRDK